MNCNCNNNKDGALFKPLITLVQGNLLRLAIPLTLRTIELVDVEVDGEIQRQVESTDTPFIPSSEHPVLVEFSKSARRYMMPAEMQGNLAYIEDKGKIPVGTYDITVTCKDDSGNPYRFKQAAVLQVVDTTKEAGIMSPIEYEVQTWYLDAAIYMALKGEDGVGVDDITVEQSSEIGGENIVTFHLSNGKTKSFSVLNGAGAVDDALDVNSPRPIANKTVTARFNALSEEIAGLFGYADYDTQSKTIRFWDKGKTKVLVSLDARPFIKDGMVNSVYISNNTLVITFNTDSGREAIGVPLSSVFNPNNYYTKVQVDNRLASSLENYYNKSYIDSRLADKASINGDRVQDFTASAFYLACEDLYDGYAVKIQGDVDHSDDDTVIYFVDLYNFGGKLQYVFPQDNETRHIATEEYVQEYVEEHGGGGGYNVTFDNGNVIFSGSNQPTFDNGNIIF